VRERRGDKGMGRQGNKGKGRGGERGEGSTWQVFFNLAGV